MRQYNEFYNKVPGEDLSLNMIIGDHLYNLNFTSLFKNVYYMECTVSHYVEDVESEEETPALVDDIDSYISSEILPDSLLMGETLIFANIVAAQKVIEHLSQLIYIVGDTELIMNDALFANIVAANVEYQVTPSFAVNILKKVFKDEGITNLTSLVVLNFLKEDAEAQQAKYEFLDENANSVVRAIFKKLLEIPFTYIPDEELRNHVLNNADVLTFIKEERESAGELFHIIINHERYTCVYFGKHIFTLIKDLTDPITAFELLNEDVMRDVEKFKANFENRDLFYIVHPPYEFILEYLSILNVTFNDESHMLNEMKSLLKLFRKNISSKTKILDRVFFQLLTEKEQCVSFSTEERGFVIDSSFEGKPFKLIIRTSLEKDEDDEVYKFESFYLEY